MLVVLIQPSTVTHVLKINCRIAPGEANGLHSPIQPGQNSVERGDKHTEIEEVDYLQALGRGCDNEVPFLYVPCTLQYIV